MEALRALAFVAGGIVLFVYVVTPAIQWLHDLIMGKAYRQAKREREIEAKAHAARWEAAERERVARKRAQDARDLERAREHNAQQRASLREKIKNDAG